MKYALIPLLLLLVACSTPEPMIDPGLSAVPMPVKGRNGFLIGQVIRYGGYATDPVRRGWTKGYDVPFFVRFRGAKEKISFTQMEPNGLRAEVSCISRFKSTELEWVRDYFYLPIDYQNYFVGTVSLYEGRENWDFIVYNPNGDFLREEASAGFIRCGNRQIDIEPIRSLPGQPAWLNQLTVYGHQFRLNGRVVAAVSTMNQGTVWMEDALSDDEKVVLASVATGLLLRRDVEEAAGDM